MAERQETTFFNDHCRGKNIVVDRNTATWEDNISHEFALKYPLSEMRGNLHFRFSGNGHATIGIAHVPDQSQRLTWLRPCSLNNKNKNGIGEINIFEDEVILYINEEIRAHWPLEQYLYSDHFLAVEIRFGNFKIEFLDLKEGNIFLALNNLGKVLEGKILQLEKPNPGAFCVLQHAWSLDCTLKIKIKPNDGVAYWKLRVYLSNKSQESIPSSEDIFLIKTLLNDHGDIIVQCQKNKREVICSFNENKVSRMVDNIDLENKVYVWFELYRCCVQVDKLDKPQVRSIYTDVRFVHPGEDFWPSDSSYSSREMNNQDETRLKSLETSPNNANWSEGMVNLSMDGFIEELYSAKKFVKEYNASNHGVFLCLEDGMREKLHDIQRNNLCDETELVLAKEILKRVFSAIHSSEHFCVDVAEGGMNSSFDEFIPELYSAKKFVKDCNTSNHGALLCMEAGMRKKLHDIERNNPCDETELAFAKTMLQRFFSVLH